MASCLALLGGAFEVERRLKGTEGSPPRAGWGRCRSPSKHFTLAGRPLSDRWVAGVMSSQRVPLCGKADSQRSGLVVVKLCWLCSPLKPRAILMLCDRAMLKEV